MRWRNERNNKKWCVFFWFSFRRWSFLCAVSSIVHSGHFIYRYWFKRGEEKVFPKNRKWFEQRTFCVVFLFFALLFRWFSFRFLLLSFRKLFRFSVSIFIMTSFFGSRSYVVCCFIISIYVLFTDFFLRSYLLAYLKMH